MIVTRTLPLSPSGDLLGCGHLVILYQAYQPQIFQAEPLILCSATPLLYRQRGTERAVGLVSMSPHARFRSAPASLAPVKSVAARTNSLFPPATRLRLPASRHRPGSPRRRAILAG